MEQMGRNIRSDRWYLHRIKRYAILAYTAYRIPSNAKIDGKCASLARISARPHKQNIHLFLHVTDEEDYNNIIKNLFRSS